jgi:hypothetical protein
MKALALAVLIGAGAACAQVGDRPTSGLTEHGFGAQVGVPAGFVPGESGEIKVWSEGTTGGNVIDWLQQGGDTSYYIFQGDDRLQTRTAGSDLVKYDVANVKDSSFFWDPVNSRFRIIGIDATTSWTSGGETEFNHFSSADLVTWTVHPKITATHLAVSGYDITHVWAPYVEYIDGKFRMWYTGVDRVSNGTSPGSKVERIFYADLDGTTGDITDPTDWENRVFCIDGEVDDPAPATDTWMSDETGWSLAVAWRAQCRDPAVLYDPVEQRWQMCMTVSGLPAAGDDQAVGVAFADDMDGPWSLVGYIESTLGSKAESTMWKRSEAMGGKYVAYVTGATSTIFISDAAYADWVPQVSSSFSLPEAIKGPFGSYDTNPPSSNVRDVWLQMQITMGIGGGFSFRTWTHHANGWTAVQSPTQLVTYSDEPVVSGLTFTDDEALAGLPTSYGVSTDATLANVFGSTTATRIERVAFTASSVSWHDLQTTAEIQTYLDIAYPDAEYRYKFYRGTESDAATALAGLSWSDWAGVRPLEETYISVRDEDVIYEDWLHVDFEVVSLWSDQEVDDTERFSWQYQGFPYSITNVAGVMNGSDVDITWDAPIANPYFVTYQVARRPLAGGDDVVLIDSGLATEAYTDVAPPSGMYFYIVYQELQNGEVSAESNLAFVNVP